MNKERRKRVSAVTMTIRSEVIPALNKCIDTLSDVEYDEKEALSNTPENLQYSEQYEESEDACETIGDAIEDLNSTIEDLEGIL